MNKFLLKLSGHKTKHDHEKWNQETIRKAYYSDVIKNLEFLPGKTADVICGFVGDDPVGLLISKERENGERIIITGFSPKDKNYWYNV